jgi:hypothetical protein
MIERPTKEFLDTLGQYVYMYDDGIEILYVGKGVGDRCLFHLKDKGFNYQQCYIVGRNLESFNDKPSLLLESYLINKHNPTNNAVSGHYKECFDMVSLASLYSEFKSEQYDNFEMLPDWYTENYDMMKGRITKVQMISDQFTVTSTAIKSLYISVSVNSESVKIILEVGNNIKLDKVEENKGYLLNWINKNDKTKDILNKDLTRSITVSCDTPLEAVTLFKEFFGA